MSKRTNRILELLTDKGQLEVSLLADLLDVSEGTVKVHMTAIFRALGVSSRAQALVVMSRHGTRLMK